MIDYSVKLDKKDWFLLFSISFGLSLLIGVLIADISGYNFFDVVLFAIGLNISISLFTLVIVTLSNKYIISKSGYIMSHIWGFVFSLSSGFLGFYFAYYLFSFFTDIVFIKEPFFVAIVVSFIAYFIGLLYYHFVYQKNIQQKLDQKLLAQKINLMQMQLNPHFLHNSLNALAELVYIDNNLAEEAIITLSSLLRDVIKLEENIKLKDEISYIKKYISLLKIQYNDKIELLYNIDEKSQEKMIPKFAIQLLVENSIKHAYNPNNKLTIKIYTQYINNILYINVSDDGVGYTNIVYNSGLSNLEFRIKNINTKNMLTFKRVDEKTIFSIILEDK